ncbi:MAG: ABC transporter ATP-binding protein [Thermoleophilia bacterium]|nr:ABC transporter ATP-binding protein [Thermoleophilia bacterium]
MIDAEDIRFSFGTLPVLRGVTLRVDGGAVVSIFGPNGASKTTLIKILAGLLRPMEGCVKVGSMELGRDPAGYRKLIGVISHQPYVYPQLSGRENLEFFGRLYGIENAKKEACRMLEQMGLAEVKDRAASTYSRGMLQRLAVGRALLHRPGVLLLDEPFTGLDQEARVRLESLLRTLRDGEKTVVMTTHDVDGGLDLADRVAVLVGGRIALEMPTGEMGRAAFLACYEEAVADARRAACERREL